MARIVEGTEIHEPTGSRAVRKADVTEDRSGRDRCSRERWRPLAQQLSARFTAAGDRDEEMIQAAVTTIVDAAGRLGAQRPDFCQRVVPLVIRALRRHRLERIRRRPAAARPLPALQLAIVAAESDLSRRLRRSPTVAEIAAHLDMAQHQVVTGLEAGWSSGPGVLTSRPETT
jgi:DNA-directed RNA polymerase specialized sigma subunit